MSVRNQHIADMLERQEESKYSDYCEVDDGRGAGSYAEQIGMPVRVYRKTRFVGMYSGGKIYDYTAYPNGLLSLRERSGKPICWKDVPEVAAQSWDDK